MRLTLEYQRVTSPFESVPETSQPLTEDVQYSHGGKYTTRFWVGNFEYTVIFDREYGGLGERSYNISFRVSDWKFSSPEEMIRIISKMAGRALDFLDAKSYLRGLNRYGITNLGDSRPIMAGVVDAIKKFFDQENPDYLIFSAHEPKRRRLYESILRNLKRKLGFGYASEMDDGSLIFKVHTK